MSTWWRSRTIKELNSSHEIRAHIQVLMGCFWCPCIDCLTSKEVFVTQLALDQHVLHKHGQQCPRRRFGKTGLHLPIISCGGMRHKDPASLRRVVDKALSHGINHFETAAIYMSGRSEQDFGNALSLYPRSSYIVQTKVTDPHRMFTSRSMFTSPPQGSASAKPCRVPP